jgi:hypothetical protein
MVQCKDEWSNESPFREGKDLSKEMLDDGNKVNPKSPEK